MITRSPITTMLDASAKTLQLYKYGRKPFVLFATGLALTLLVLHLVLNVPGIRGVSPKHPEWKASTDTLRIQVRDILRKLVYAGSFVLGVSQAVKKQRDIYAPDLSHAVLYGKLIVFMLAIEFVCGIMTSPRKSGRLVDGVPGSVIDWLQEITGSTAREMVNGASTGFGYGYLIRGVGYLFERYTVLKPDA